MNESFDVILVGGGVMGCATAFYLLKMDNRLNVAIIEKDPSYAKASTTLSDGNIRTQFNLKENIEISQFGLQELENFTEEMEVDSYSPDPTYRRQGNLFLFDETGREAAENGFNLQKSLGCEIEWLSPAEIGQRFPMLVTESIAGGTFGQNEGTMDPHAVLQGFKNKAIALGADYHAAEVESITTNNGEILGVKLTSGETISAKIVVNSAGPWMPIIAKKLGIDLPIVPVKRQVFVLETSTTPDRTIPLIVFPSGLYLIHEHDSSFLCGKSLIDDPITLDDFNWKLSQFEERLWPELFDYIPAFDRLKVASGWAGLYAVNTLDGNAILGEWPGINGHYLIGGFSGHGFQQAFGVGRYIAELILERPVTLDLSIFSPQRIIDNRPVFENPGRLV